MNSSQTLSSGQKTIKILSSQNDRIKTNKQFNDRKILNLSNDQQVQVLTSPRTTALTNHHLKHQLTFNINNNNSNLNHSSYNNLVKTTPSRMNDNYFSTPKHIKNNNSNNNQNGLQTIDDKNNQQSQQQQQQIYSRSDFGTYANQKQQQQQQFQMQYKSYSHTNSPMQQTTQSFLKREPMISQFAPNLSNYQRQFEKFINKSQKSLLHFTVRNKQTLNEKNIQIPHILSDPEKVDILFNDMHFNNNNSPSIRNSSKENNSISQMPYSSYFKSYETKGINNNAQIDFLRNRTSQGTNRIQNNINGCSMPSLLNENQYNKTFTLLKQEKKDEDEQEIPLSPIKRIFNQKKSGKQPDRLQLSDCLSSGIYSPVQLITPVNKNTGLTVKITSQFAKQSNSPLITSPFNNVDNSPQKQLLKDLTLEQQQQYEEEIKMINRKKISWSDEMYLDISKKQFKQSSSILLQEENNNNNIHDEFNKIKIFDQQQQQQQLSQKAKNNKNNIHISHQKTFDNIIESPILPRKIQSMQFSEIQSPLKSNDKLKQSKVNEQRNNFIEQIKKQMCLVDQNPKDSVIDRNFKKFKVIEDLQKLRIQEKINQFKIIENVGEIKQDILKRNPNKTITIPTQQQQIKPIKSFNQIQTTQNQINSYDQIHLSPDQNCPKIKIVDENEINPEDIEQYNNLSDFQINSQKTQQYQQQQNGIQINLTVQAPPSLQNIDSAITINEIEPVNSLDSVEKYTSFSGLLKKSLKINLQGLMYQQQQQNMDDEMDSPQISQSQNGREYNTSQPQSSSKMKQQSSIELKAGTPEQRSHANTLSDKPSKVSPSPSTQTSQMEINNLNSFSQLEPKMMLRKQQTQTLKLKSIQSQDIADSQMSEIENLVKNHTNDNSFSTNSPRSPYIRKQQKHSTKKSAFTQINSNLNTPKSGRTMTRILTINPKIPSHDQILLLDGFWNEEEIKILNELSFFIADLMKTLQSEISIELKNNISYFCTEDLNQFIFSISQYIQYICTDNKQNRNDHYICPFKLNPTLIDQILQVFLDKLTSLKQDVRTIDIFRNAFNKHKQLILAVTIQERLGGDLQKQRIISEVIDYQIQNSTNQIFERIQKEDLMLSQYKTLNLILKSSEEEIKENEWNEVRNYNAVDIFESKKAFLTVMRRHKNFYDENYCFEFIQQIERCRDYICHSLSIHRYEKDLKFMKSLRDYLQKIQFIQKISCFNERDNVINTIILYIFSTSVTSNQLISLLNQHIPLFSNIHLNEIKDIIHHHLRLDPEYNENPEYGQQFQYKFSKLFWFTNIKTTLFFQLGDLTSFFEQFNQWIDKQIEQKNFLNGYEPYEVKSIDNLQTIIELYFNKYEVYHIKDAQFSMSLPILEPEPLIKFWMKGIKNTIITHCGLEKDQAKIIRNSISDILISNIKNNQIKRSSTSNTSKNTLSN